MVVNASWVMSVEWMVNVQWMVFMDGERMFD